MKRILLSLVLFYLPLAALADGMVIPTIAYPAKVTIPDQRALICFSNGTERLVIETRFTGAGTNFAWVVPLPSRPVIEAATTGLFPTLQYLFRPQIIHEVPRYYLGILATVTLIYIIRLLTKYGSVGFVICYLLYLVVIAGLLLPALAPARKGAMSLDTSESLGTSERSVSVLERKIVGIFETTTIASHDAKALQNWLLENGYSVPTNSDPVIASYVKDGWVFVAAKVRRDNAASDTSTPHPLSFTFKTDKPVYPMQLTGLNGHALSVALYVFGPMRATAPHLEVERCTQPNYPAIPEADPYWLNWRRWSPETPNIVHPLLRKWTDGLPVATKLVGTLSSVEMRQDVWLDWSAFSEKRNHLFSSAGAFTVAANWGTGFFAAGLLIICALAFVGERHKATLPKRASLMIIVSLVLIGMVYICLPKTEVRLTKISSGKTENMLFRFGMEASDEITNRISLADARLTAANIIRIAQTNAPYWNEWSQEVDWKNWRNDYLGSPLHEEDSPGNYIIRETNGQLQFVSYDAEGAEHIQAIGQ